MGAYILRRLLLVIPTLLGIMIINFALVQFVPGGPIEQILANLEGRGDVFESFRAGLATPISALTTAANMLAHAACHLNSSHSWNANSVSTSRRWSGSSI